MTEAGRRFIRMEELKRKVGKSRTGIYDAIRAGRFPKPIHIGPRSSAWDSDAIEIWMDERIAESRGEAVQ